MHVINVIPGECIAECIASSYTSKVADFEGYTDLSGGHHKPSTQGNNSVAEPENVRSVDRDNHIQDHPLDICRIAVHNKIYKEYDVARPEMDTKLDDIICEGEHGV